MKIAVSSTGTELTSLVDPRFGRCPYFIIVDNNSLSFKALPNSGLRSAHGAGIHAAQLVASEGVKVVLTGQIGPNAYRALTASKVKVLTNASGTVREALDLFKRGELVASPGPTVGGHFGTGGRGRGQGRGGRRPQGANT